MSRTLWREAYRLARLGVLPHKPHFMSNAIINRAVEVALKARRGQ